MKLSEEDKKLVLKSIKHWKKDIVKRFKNDKLEQPPSSIILVPSWKSNGEKIKSYANYCALCTKYLERECKGCPYLMFYKKPCWKNGMHWDNFNTEKTLENAEDMVKALEDIIK